MRVPDAVANDAREDGRELREPARDADRMLVVPPPHDRDDGCDGENDRFKYAHEEADGEEAAVVLGSGRAHHEGRPGKHGESEELAHGQTLDENRGRVLEREIAKVEDGADPVEVVAHEMGIRPHAVDGRIGDDDLVDSADDGGDPQQRKNGQIDLPE